MVVVGLLQEDGPAKVGVDPLACINEVGGAGQVSAEIMRTVIT